MLYALKLELQIVVSRLIDMGMGNGTQVPEGCFFLQPGNPERG